MKLFVVLSCLAAVAFAVPTEEYKMSFWPQPSARANGRIINGANAEQNAAPFIGSMRWGITNMQHSCGCSLISNQWVLSAAHCITELPATGRLEIQFGVTHRTNDIANQRIHQFHRVNDVHLHPQWVPGGVAGHDVVMIQLPQAVDFTPQIQPIRLRRAGYTDSGVCRLFGWGSINSSQIFPNIPLHLQTAEKDILTDEECRRRLAAINPNFVTPLVETNKCAARGNISACGGDSGGPLVVRENDAWVQIGVVSWGISPCGSIFEVPSVYAQISGYVPWISTTTGIAQADFTI